MEQIAESLCELRRARAETLAQMSQADVVGAVCEWARRWRDEEYLYRHEAVALTEPFPFAMTRVSLDALLESLTPEALWALIDAEEVREAFGVSLVGHVIAGNTPLLAWVSVLRALLMRSASFVKLPSGAAEWGRLFLRSLEDTAPELAASVQLAQWPGGSTVWDTSLCRGVDLVMAHGSDKTIQALHALCPPSVDFVGYGHRVSFGLVLLGAATDEAARGFARDVLLYDQGGCLSPHTVFVEGTWEETVAFGARLADALTLAVQDYPLAVRSPQAAMRVREARLLGRMTLGTRVWEDAALRWTVIARPEREFALSPTHGVVSVQPLESLEMLPQALLSMARYLQGCAVAEGSQPGKNPPPGFAVPLPKREGRQHILQRAFRAWHSQGKLTDPLEAAERSRSFTRAVSPPASGPSGAPVLGVARNEPGWVLSRLCAPGDLQTPPFSWRQDGRDVLRTLLPSRGQDNERRL